MNGHKQQGFVLVVVLWSIVALTIITGGLMATINSTLEQAYRMQDIARQDRELFATEQTLLYLLAVRPRNPAGVDLDPQERQTADPFARVEYDSPRPILRLDGTSYDGYGQAQFKLWDSNARFSVFEPRRDVWQRMMEVLETPPSDADRWYDQLMDYLDLDSFARLNGMEEEGYRSMGLPPPPNRFLISPHELFNLPIALDLPELTHQLVALSTSRVGGLANPNTSPAAVLRAELGLTERDADQVLENRENRLFQSVSDLSREVGVIGGDGLNMSWLTGSNVLVVLLDDQGRQRRWIAVEFTPDTEGQPWYIDYNHPVDLQTSQQESRASDVFQLDRPTGTAAPATDWAPYPAFFPPELPLAQ